MKKLVASVAFLTILGLTTSCATGGLSSSLGGSSQSSSSTGLGNLLGGDLGSTLGNVLEGVFSSSNLSVSDLQGVWTATGSAVCFQSSDLLKKAGGIAAAAAIESKLDPYYKKYGLDGSQLTVNSDGTFTLVMKNLRLSGNITPKSGAEKGVFDFNFTILGQKIGTVPTYIQKSYSSMDVMFDATKLKTLLSGISQFVGSSIVSSIVGIIDSYDGLCVGFNFQGGSTNSTSTSGFNLGDLLNGTTGTSTGTSNKTNTGGSSLKNGTIK